MKRDAVPIHATTRTDLRNVTPSERSQRAKATCGAIRLTCNVFLKQGKSMQMADWWLPGGQGGGRNGASADGEVGPLGVQVL